MRGLFAMLAFVPCVCIAGDADEGKWWLVATAVSKHVNVNDALVEEEFNERNPGIGVEYHHSQDVILMAGEYRNSVYRTTWYAVAGYTPIRLGFVSIGAAAGLINGYPAYNDGKPAPAAVGLVRAEGDRIGANLILIPPIKAKFYTPLTIGLQLKYRF